MKKAAATRRKSFEMQIRGMIAALPGGVVAVAAGSVRTQAGRMIVSLIPSVNSCQKLHDIGSLAKNEETSFLPILPLFPEVHRCHYIRDDRRREWVPKVTPLGER
jgi:hypothetical protein